MRPLLDDPMAEARATYRAYTGKELPDGLRRRVEWIAGESFVTPSDTRRMVCDYLMDREGIDTECEPGMADHFHEEARYR